MLVIKVSRRRMRWIRPAIVRTKMRRQSGQSSANSIRVIRRRLPIIRAKKVRVRVQRVNIVRVRLSSTR